MAIQFSLGDGSALKDPAKKRTLNREMFAIIAPRYDWITRILSFGRDQSWKRDLIRRLPNLSNPLCLDIASGTGDLSRRLSDCYPQGKIIAIDICDGMLMLASKQKYRDNLHFVLSDMQELPLADASIDVVTGGYALRNAPNLEKLLTALFNALKPDGTAIFLDFSRPAEKRKALRQQILLTFWTRLWGRILHGNPEVYGYIAESLTTFPNTEELKRLVCDKGFRNFKLKKYLGGFIAIVEFRK